MGGPVNLLNIVSC